MCIVHVARDRAALCVSTHRSGHRSPGARRGMAGGGATVAEVEQGKALEHPRRRGHPPGMWVEVVAHRSFLPTGRGKTGSVAAFSDEVRAPAAGGGPASGWRGERTLSSIVPGEKVAGGVLGLRSSWRVTRWRRRPDSSGDALRQGHDVRMVMWSASGTGGGAVGTARVRRRRQRGGIFGHGRSETAGRDGF
jgi:hypothetical protein